MKSIREIAFKNVAILAIAICVFTFTGCGQGKSPIERFSANPDTISAGQTTRLSWKVNGALKVIMSGVSSISGSSVVVAPAHSTTYILKAIMPSGRSYIQKLKVHVLADTVVAEVTIDPAKPGNAVPSGFLGLSHEWGQAQLMIGDPLIGKNEIYRQLLSNLMAYGGGPVSIRIGGGTTDNTQEPKAGTVRPFAQLYEDLSRKGNGLRFILGVNLGAKNFYRAANQAWAFVNGMPKGSIQAIEIGNEPDVYPMTGYRPKGYSFDDYLTEFHKLTQYILYKVPGCPPFMGPSDASFAGVPATPATPATNFGNLNDLKRLLEKESSVLGIVSQHAYTAGSSYCGGNPKSGYLLRPASSMKNPRLAVPYAAIAKAWRIPYRIAEMNSIACSGEPGVSDAFEAALWTSDVLFEYARDGIAGVNLHANNWNAINGWDVNGAFLFDVPQSQYHIAHTIKPPAGTVFTRRYELKQVQPIYYGMLFFAEATAHQAKLLPVSLKTPANLKVWATLNPKTGNVNVMIINKDKSAAGNVVIKVPGYGSGTVIRMTAPSFTAKRGITIGGQTFDGSRDGKPLGKRHSENVSGKKGTFKVSVGPTSAILVMLNN